MESTTPDHTHTKRTASAAPAWPLMTASLLTTFTALLLRDEKTRACLGASLSSNLQDLTGTARTASHALTKTGTTAAKGVTHTAATVAGTLTESAGKLTKAAAEAATGLTDSTKTASRALTKTGAAAAKGVAHTATTVAGTLTESTGKLTKAAAEAATGLTGTLVKSGAQAAHAIGDVAERAATVTTRLPQQAASRARKTTNTVSVGANRLKARGARASTNERAAHAHQARAAARYAQREQQQLRNTLNRRDVQALIEREVGSALERHQTRHHALLDAALESAFARQTELDAVLDRRLQRLERQQRGGFPWGLLLLGGGYYLYRNAAARERVLDQLDSVRPGSRDALTQLGGTARRAGGMLQDGVTRVRSGENPRTVLREVARDVSGTLRRNGAGDHVPMDPHLALVPTPGASMVAQSSVTDAQVTAPANKLPFANGDPLHQE